MDPLNEYQNQVINSMYTTLRFAQIRGENNMILPIFPNFKIVEQQMTLKSGIWAQLTNGK